MSTREPESHRSRISDEEIARLVASAGARPAVPPEAMAEITAATRREWERVTSAPDRLRAVWPRRLAAAAALVVALGLGWRWVSPDAGSATPAFARVDRVEVGATVILGGRGEIDLVPGAAVDPGAVVSVRGGAVSLRWSDGHSVRIQDGSTVRLASVGLLALDEGLVYVASDPGRPAALGGLEVKTPLGVVTEIGTRFEVRYRSGADEPLRVRVREGEVVLASGDLALQARAGEELGVALSGEVRRAACSTHGATWSWLAPVSSRLDIEGVTLETYLAWLVRETGWTVRLADGAAVSAVGEIVLHGDLDEMTPAETVPLVLPGTGLAWELEAGVLTLAERP